LGAAAAHGRTVLGSPPKRKPETVSQWPHGAVGRNGTPLSSDNSDRGEDCCGPRNGRL